MRKSIYAIFAAAALFALASGANAQSTGNSDRLLILGPNGAPLFDQTISDITVPPVGESNAIYNPPGVAPVDPVALATAGANVVFLLEPASEIPNPGESPIFVFDAAGNKLQVSDGIVSSLGTTLPPQVELISDGSPDLARLAGAQPNFPKAAFILAETGNLQDLTGPLGGFNGAAPTTILVQSDVSAPEPASVSLLGLAATGLVARRRRA
ncbi:MAG: hypothetical protein JWN24_306 [Phycisphaerales bacterium]|nr:hypothetical protein [Phycisphaerales bacterium]